MKTLLISILIFISFEIFSQSSSSIIISPEDVGIGPLGSYKFGKSIVSAGVSYGNYYNTSFLRDHWKTYTSYGYFFGDHSYLLVDIHYNQFNIIREVPSWFNEKALTKWTYSIGGGIILDQFHSTLQVDLIQHIGTVSFGYYFGRDLIYK
jgi:hypothetical protein